MTETDYDRSTELNLLDS